MPDDTDVNGPYFLITTVYSQYISVYMHPSAGYYLVQNQIITSRWMHIKCLSSSLKLDGSYEL